MAVLGIHLGLRPVVQWIDLRRKVIPDAEVETYYRMQIECDPPQDAHVRHILLRHVGTNDKLTLHGMSTEDAESGKRVVVADIYAPTRNDRLMEELVSRVSIEPEICSVSWQRSPG